MTTHEMILLCSSSQGVRTCIPLCLVLILPPLQPLENLLTPHLWREACCSMLQHSKFFLGTIDA